MLQPLAEYASLHLFVITGGSDELTNFVQWFASVACIVAVSSIAKEFGAAARGQAIAALFCATLPSGVLASSGAKNDYVLAMWLCAAVYFALRFAATRRDVDSMWTGAALGLALLTKATAYLFAPWLLLASCISWPIHSLAVSSRNRARQQAEENVDCSNLIQAAGRTWKVRPLAIAALFAVLINTPHYLRNLALSGSPLGFPSAQGDNGYRWRNDTLGLKPTTTNILRNVSDQLGARSESWNQSVYQFVMRSHQWLGIDVNAPATTWPGTTFAAPRNANHEADVPNRWHLLLVILAAAVSVWTRNWRAALFALALACGFIAFCAYLKWQPFLSRLFLPLFVLASPIVGIAAEKLRFAAIQVALCLFLLSTARLPALENWTRPLRGPHSVLHTPRDEQYFNDMVQFGDHAPYFRAVDRVAASGCKAVGIDININQLEYPLQDLLRRRMPDVQFVHVAVHNASSRYASPVSATPCAIVCIDCGNDRLVTFPR
jgi:hypothetical protein